MTSPKTTPFPPELRDVLVALLLVVGAVVAGTDHRHAVLQQLAEGEERERRLVDDREHVFVLDQVLGRGEVARTDDASSLVTYVILRPSQPPAAFCALIRASKPLMPFFEIDEATPVSGEM